MHPVLNPTIVIRNDEGKTLSLPFHSTKTILECKKEIEDIEGVLFNTLQLRFAGEKLTDERSLKDYGISANTTLCLTKTVQIFIKTLTGKTITLEVSLQDTVTHVKQQICDKTQSPCNQQNLLFSGQTLDDKQTLSSYNIQRESTLNMYLMVRGD